MPTFDFAAAKHRVRSTIGSNKLGRLKLLIVPFTTHVGSVVTIAVAWFARGGSFAFDPASPKDWGAAALAIVTAIGGIIIIRNTTVPPAEMIVTRNEVSDLLAAGRIDAERSIDIVAGDLSWLSDDLESLVELKRQKPYVRVSLYYDRHRVSAHELPQVKVLDASGITLRPYPDGSSSPSARFTLLDRTNPATVRAFVYNRIAAPPIDQQRMDNLFRWREFGPNDSVLIDSFMTILNSIEQTNPPCMSIGILGLNNVGKTTLSQKLRTLLSRNYRTRIIPDQFRLYNNGSTVEKSLEILATELLNVDKEKNADIVIYDRTPLDNLLFLRLRANDYHAFSRIAAAVDNFMETIDMIVIVRKEPEDFTTPTSYVTGSERYRVQQMFESYFQTHNLERWEVVLRKQAFLDDVDDAAEGLRDEIIRIYHERRIAPYQP